MESENQLQFFSNPHLAGVTLLHATMSDFSYDKHAHEEYAIGVTLKGRQSSPTIAVIIVRLEPIVSTEAPI